MKKAIFVALLASTLHILPTNDAQALTSERGVGIVARPNDVEEASLKATPARVSRWGLIPSQLRAQVFEPYRNPLTAGEFRMFGVSADVAIYLKTSAGERLVHTGPMELVQENVIAALPPTNARPEGKTHEFLLEIGNPKNTKSLKLEPGDYRAETVFYRQDLSIGARATGWMPPKAECAGAAVEFTVGNYHLADLVDPRGEIRVQSVVSVRKGASVTQIAQLKSAAAAEYKRVVEGSRNFLKKEAGSSVGGPARAPWIFTEDARVSGNFSTTFFQVQSGESYAANSGIIKGALAQVVKGGNISRKLPGGTFKITTTSNITLHAR